MFVFKVNFWVKNNTGRERWRSGHRWRHDESETLWLKTQIVHCWAVWPPSVVRTHASLHLPAFCEPKYATDGRFGGEGRRSKERVRKSVEYHGFHPPPSWNGNLILDDARRYSPHTPKYDKV